jgi:hypothetical protein
MIYGGEYNTGDQGIILVQSVMNNFSDPVFGFGPAYVPESAVPEPSTYAALAGLALLAWAAQRRRRRRRRA